MDVGPGMTNSEPEKKAVSITRCRRTFVDIWRLDCPSWAETKLKSRSTGADDSSKPTKVAIGSFRNLVSCTFFGEGGGLNERTV